jgi:hypothetical protein
MTPAQRDRAFAAARGRIVRAQTTHMRGTRAELVRLLAEAQRAIAAQLAAQPSDYERWSLPRLGAEVRRALAEFGERGAARAGSAIGRAWELGEDLVDAPIEAAGVRVAGVLGRIDTRQLQAMRSFMVDRIKDIGVEAANKISAELGLVVIGARSPSDAIRTVTQILGGESRARATTIVRTELGRAFSHATQLRLEAAHERLPGLKKQWRRSGKLHPRLHHDLADGQVVDVDAPFVLKPLGRSPVELMYPRDPAAPAAETINCGCESIPFMEHWTVKHPGRTPGSPLLDDSESLADILARQDKRAKTPA